MKYMYTIHGRLWFDKTWGNTYHSCVIVRHEDGATVYCGEEYGYGDQYVYTALAAAERAGWGKIHRSACLAYSSNVTRKEHYKGDK